MQRLLVFLIAAGYRNFGKRGRYLSAKIEGVISSGAYDVGLEMLRAESFVVTHL